MERYKPFTTRERLEQIMELRSMKQIDIVNACQPYCEKYHVKLSKPMLSQYINGVNEPKQDVLAILAMGLNVSEAWLMGLDAPMHREKGVSQEKNDADNAYELFLRLDDIDKAKILERMLTLLDSDKYKKAASK